MFPPGTEHDAADPAGGQAQADLTDAYGNAKGRSFDTTTTAELAGKTLGPGVYIGPGKSPLWIGGALTLDGEDNPDAVFIFQTDSTLVTGSASSVRLINGAKECNVFWQVGSSATLGTFSSFTGTILALTSVTVTTGVTVHGRALATTGAVTLDDDTFIAADLRRHDCHDDPVRRHDGQHHPRRRRHGHHDAHRRRHRHHDADGWRHRHRDRNRDRRHRHVVHAPELAEPDTSQGSRCPGRRRRTSYRCRPAAARGFPLARAPRRPARRSRNGQPDPEPPNPHRSRPHAAAGAMSRRCAACGRSCLG